MHGIGTASKGWNAASPFAKARFQKVGDLGLVVVEMPHQDVDLHLNLHHYTAQE
jgi:hypothetical protein